ncbi:MAG: hypothetical protein OEV44_08155 [Spirochaetota bacterium]|nr:hypothetical protein [Spirochaetota bacterium]
MSKLNIISFISLMLLTLNYCENKEKNNHSSKSNSSDDYLSKINENLIKRESKKIVVKESKETKVLKESKVPKTDKLTDTKDLSWVIQINKTKISKEVFEHSYNKYKKIIRGSFSKRDFVNVFMQNYAFTAGVGRYFRTKKPLKDLIRRQAIIEYFLKKNVFNKKIKNPTDEELKLFHSQLVKQKEYEKLNLFKDRSKIVNFYKIQIKNQNYMLLQQTLKGEFRIMQNDEWEKDIINKYINNKINLKTAMGDQYKTFWLYKILPKGANKKSMDNAMVIHVKDIEEKLKMINTLKLNPMLINSFAKNPIVRKQYIDKCLFEELVYKRLEKNNILYSGAYKQFGDKAVKNFSQRYYLQHVLGIKTQNQQRKYLMNYLSSHKVKINEKYFENNDDIFK